MKVDLTTKSRARKQNGSTYLLVPSALTTLLNINVGDKVTFQIKKVSKGKEYEKETDENN